MYLTSNGNCKKNINKKLKNFKSYFANNSSCAQEYLKNGYYIGEIENIELFREFNNQFNHIVKKLFKKKTDDFTLEKIHKIVNFKKINDFRIKIFHELNKVDDILPLFYFFAKQVIDEIIGNEIVMQKQVNLSIQMPNDKNSTLNIHSDTFNGESPYQAVLWIPLTDAYKTNSMFILSPSQNSALVKKMKQYKDKPGIKKIYSDYQKKAKFVEIKKGQFLIFNSNLMHGNITNNEINTRWSLNTRVKSLFSPYTSSEKNIGNFYKPLTLKPATIMGLKFEKPV